MENEKIIAVAKAFFILLVMCCFSSCSSNLDKQRRLQKSSTNVTVNGSEISIIEYDSCEYLISGIEQSQMITHKGNCKYCAKRSLK